MNKVGIGVSLLASVTFAAFTYVAKFTPPLSGTQLWGWRIMLTVPGIILTFIVSGRGRSLVREIQIVRENPSRLLSYAFCAPMLAVQMLLFGWAPQMGRTLELALGYFLMPVVMVLAGRFVYKERMSPLSALAAVLAGCAVIYQVVSTGQLGWVALIVALGYPLYFMVHKYFHTEGVSALTWEMILASPLALWFALARGGVNVPRENPRLIWIILLIGAVSVVAMIVYALSARVLPYSVFGLMTYVEPVLVSLLAMAAGERISPGEIILYIGIYTAVGLLGVDGLLAIVHRERWRAFPARPWIKRRRRKSPRSRHFRRDRTSRSINSTN